MDKLLTRAEFEQQVFERDNATCVVCGQPALDAHHIMERRLWTDGGYYLSNGVSLCDEHHMLAEMTLISPDELREYAGITKVLIPDSLYRQDAQYDKWGNTILSDGRRSPGELFYDESVQKVLGKAGVLDLFTKYVKYPRTPHLPYSPGFSKDDINWTTDQHLIGQEVVVTEKMDGENTTMYRDFIHARSVETMKYHKSRTWIKNLHAQIAHDIPEGYRICGENVYAKHSLAYTNLPDYFLVFSIWNQDVCLPWDTTVEWCDLLGLKTVPVIYRGEYHEQVMDQIGLDPQKHEGFVVRPAHAFILSDFRKRVAKYVRANHVQTHAHWYHDRVIPNEIGVKC